MNSNNSQGYKSRIVQLLILSATVIIVSLRFTAAPSAFGASVICWHYWCDEPFYAPALHGAMESQNSVSFPGASVPIELEKLTLEVNQSEVVVVPPAGSPPLVTSSFFDIFTEFNYDSTHYAIDSFFDITYRLEYGTDPGSEPFWDVEVLGLQLQSPTGPASIILRESPTLASTGFYSKQILPDFSIIDGFFDVFFELSLDDGQSWHAASGPMHIELIRLPEPGTILLTTSGLLGVGIAARRRKCA